MLSFMVLWVPLIVTRIFWSTTQCGVPKSEPGSAVGGDCDGSDLFSLRVHPDMGDLFGNSFQYINHAYYQADLVGTQWPWV